METSRRSFFGRVLGGFVAAVVGKPLVERSTLGVHDYIAANVWYEPSSSPLLALMAKQPQPKYLFVSNRWYEFFEKETRVWEPLEGEASATPLLSTGGRPGFK